LDKDSLSLIGVKDKTIGQERDSTFEPHQSRYGAQKYQGETSVLKTSNEPNVVSLDPRCLNCDTDGSQKTILFQKFKLACLSYKPTPIVMEGISYNRKDVYDMQQEMLDSSRNVR